jgi:type IV pilus assembly protein PilA
MQSLRKKASRIREARLAELSGEEKAEKETGVSGIIELVIVLVILGILTAILLPTFLGTTTTAKNKSAESNLSTSVTEAQTMYANNSSTFPATATLVGSLNTAEPELSFSSAWPATSGNGVGVVQESASDVVMGAESSSGSCIYVSINNATATAGTATPWLNNSGTSWASAAGACAAPAAGMTFTTTTP